MHTKNQGIKPFKIMFRFGSDSAPYFHSFSLGSGSANFIFNGLAPVQLPSGSKKLISGLLGFSVRV